MDGRKVKVKKKVIKKKPAIALGAVLCGFIVIFFAWYFLLVPKIDLKGDLLVKVKYGEEYREEGYAASYLGSDITDKVWIEGDVNTNIVGKYRIKYKVRKNKITSTKERVVEVIDDISPVITLMGDSEAYVCPNKEYEEEGFLANDNYDGEITENVKKENEDDYILYTVLDSSDNKTEVKRKIIKEDKEGPMLDLNGGENVNIIVGAKYNEQGYTAVDNCEGDLTSKVKVEGSVDTSKEGSYTLTYSVSDNAGNSSTKKRVVNVKKNYQKIAGNLTCGNAGVIYLTFDDGPQSQYNTTSDILDTLKKYNVKATFFVTGFGPDDLIKREYDEGHVIALHSNTHDYAKIYVSSEAFWKDINTVSARVERITGKKANLLRFPGGVSNTVSRKYNQGIMTRLANEALQKGYNYYDWNISSGDAGGLKSSTYEGKLEEEYNNVVKYLSKKRGNVILMHDTKATSRDVLERVIKYGIDNGYKFDVLESSIICRQAINN